MKLKKRQTKQLPSVEVDSKIFEELSVYLENLQNPPSSFERGQIITGKIVSVGKGEILVDVGGRSEGVVSGREMKLEGETLDKKPGEEVLVYVIKGENDKGQIELSIRRTGTARKWYDLKRAQETDQPLSVKAVEANTGGLIVDVGGGLRGFIPTSQLDSARIFGKSVDYDNKERANQELQSRLADLIGTEISVKIVEIDREKNRVIFSEKLVTSNADMEMRGKTLSKATVGVNLEAEVTGIAPFGLFVNAEGLEGLVHLSEISWDKVTNPGDFFKVGDKVKVQVIGIQDEGKRVAYSIKRLQPDPWDELVKDYKVGQSVDAVITKVVEYGAFVRIGDKLNGLIHISEMSDKLVRDPNDIVKIGDAVKLMIISISREDRHLGLSLKRSAGGGKEAKSKSKSKSATTEEIIAEVNGKNIGTTSAGDLAPELESLRNILGEEESSKE